MRACGSAWQVTRMSEQDQAAVIAFLADPASHGGGEVERIDTHASIVFLAGDHADAVIDTARQISARAVALAPATANEGNERDR